MSARELRLCEAAKPESAALLRHALDDFLKSHEVDRAKRIDVVTAVGEAVANSIEHAYGRGERGNVEVNARIERDGTIRVDIIDTGTFVNRTRREHRGFGIPIIQAAVRSMTIETQRGTIVRLLFDPASA
jgi:serine/threonine-protein kinase RsbW